MKTTPLWSPSTETVDNLAMAQFMTEINAADGLSAGVTAAFHAFSICETRSFHFLGVIGERGDGPHLERRRKFAPRDASV